MSSFFNRFHSQFTQWLLIGVIVPTAALNLWLIFKVVQYAQPLVSILVSAVLLAFLLNYPIQFLQGWGLGRGYAIASVILLAFSLLVGASITILPQATEELGELVSALPTWIQSTDQKLQIIQGWATQHHIPIYLNQWTNQFAEQLPNRLQALGDTALNLLFSALGGVSNLALTGIFAVYLLLDGEQLWNGIFQRLPSKKTAQIQRSLQQHFQDYFTGQAIIAALMSTLLTLIFLVLRVPFPLLLGLFIGTLSVIPFGVLFASLISALLVATDDPSFSLRILGAAIVTNQVMDQLITPRLMGNLVGLRPIWVLLALLVGAKVGGLVGLLIAVPIASFLKDAIEGFPDTVISTEDLAVASNLAHPEAN
jgi:predicted PurR-regulated permease PerM